MSEDKLIDLVTDVRLKFEKGRIPKKELTKLYFKYNPNVDINIFVEHALEMFPNLNCGLASVYLQEVLGGKIVRGQYKNYSHTFLLLNRKIIDITADQYGGPMVYVGEPVSPWQVYCLC